MDPGRPSENSPKRSLCVGFWAVNTIAIYIRTDKPLAKSRGCIKLQEVRTSLWPMSFPVYASIVSFGLRLLYNCNTRYEWLVRPCSPGTFTLEEAPSFAWRTNGVAHRQADGRDLMGSPTQLSRCISSGGQPALSLSKGRPPACPAHLAGSAEPVLGGRSIGG